jgi:hypothetical protein
VPPSGVSARRLADEPVAPAGAVLPEPGTAVVTLAGRGVWRAAGRSPGLSSLLIAGSPQVAVRSVGAAHVRVDATFPAHGVDEKAI